MIHDCDDIAEYIAKNYPKAKKIVEAGIGSETCVFEKLKEKNFNVIAFDSKPTATPNSKTRIIKSNVIKTSVFSPEAIEISRGADLIYAIRPNPELTEALIKMAEKVKVDLLIRPFATDEKLENMKLVNYKRARMWLVETK